MIQSFRRKKTSHAATNVNVATIATTTQNPAGSCAAISSCNSLICSCSVAISLIATENSSVDRRNSCTSPSAIQSGGLCNNRNNAAGSGASRRCKRTSTRRNWPRLARAVLACLPIACPRSHRPTQSNGARSPSTHRPDCATGAPAFLLSSGMVRHSSPRRAVMASKNANRFHNVLCRTQALVRILSAFRPETPVNASVWYFYAGWVMATTSLVTSCSKSKSSRRANNCCPSVLRKVDLPTRSSSSSSTSP